MSGGRPVAVVGGGWAGLAAAVLATRAGHRVTLYEAARTLGGRARRLDVTLPGGRDIALDNGQHIMIGAYTETLALMESVGVQPADVLLRMPLALRFPDGSGIALPDWPAPLDAAAGVLSARGWTLADKLSLLRACAGWQLRGFRCDAQLTVAALCESLTPRVMRELVEPLCVSALNTPAARASAAVFLRVLRDSLFGKGHGRWGGSNLLVPRADLGELFPRAAAQWLQQHGAKVLAGRRVASLERDGNGWRVDGAPFDRVVIAASPWEAARLLHDIAPPWAAMVDAFEYEPIATVYAMSRARLGAPLLALRNDAQRRAQFVFDRGQLGGPQGLLAFVVSASSAERDVLQAQVVQQAKGLGWAIEPVQTVIEKRATFACTPALQRPPVAVAPGLLACGDYVEGPYPATIEGAVRAAQEATALL